MKAANYFLKAGVIAIGMWIFSQASMLICFFTYQVFGKYIWVPFYFLATWQDLLLTKVLPAPILKHIYSAGWLSSVALSLVAWMLLVLAISGIRFYAISKKPIAE